MTFWQIGVSVVLFCWSIAILVATHRVNVYYKASRAWHETLKREKDLMMKFAAALKSKEELLNAMMEKSQ